MDILKATWKYFRPYKMSVILFFIMGLIVTLLNMVNPYVTKLIFDKVIDGKQAKLLTPLLLTMIGATIIKHIFQYTRSYIIQKVSVNVSIKIREDVFKKFLYSSFEYFNREKSGDIMTLMTSDAEAVKNLIANTIPAVIEMLVSFTIACIILFGMNVKMTLFCFIIIPIVYFLTKNFSREMRYQHANIRKKTANLNTVVQENINGVRIVRAFTREDFEKQKFDRVNGDFRQANMDHVDVWSRYNWKLSLSSNYPYIVSMLYGSILAIQGKITLGTYVAFGGYIGYIMNPINSISNYVSSIQSAMASGDKVFGFLNMDAGIKSMPGAEKLENFHGNIKFENVGFQLDGNKILKNINIDIEQGKKIGIMGATGSGKTSIVSLLGRYYDCTSGKILIDGVDIKNVELQSWRKKIAYVMQDVFLFSDSVEGNIAFSDPDDSFEQVEESAKSAEAHGFIMDMPEKYDTIVGERGIGLSGGQKQRISIARAAIMDVPVIVLDDATSSVDMETEHAIQSNLKKIMDGKTEIVIAHRISSVRDADEIIFLKDGEIAERGTHEELINKGGLYAEVYKEQYGENQDALLAREAAL